MSFTGGNSPPAASLHSSPPKGALCPQDKVHHFFAALPPDKVPRIGTPGEQWRKRQLERQLPPQDADARFCGNLSAKETCELEAFVRERREKALGRGEVRRL
uniref:PET domain-containing protein n=1 Tax=Globodera pallida TaxID=36090 RepID=A0A183BXS8_GLOPA